MSKKNFKNNPALTFINSTQDNAHDVTHDVAQYDAHDNAQQTAHDVTQPLTHVSTQESTHERAHDDAPYAAQEADDSIRSPYIRTQGRKGHKKPRINLAFDSEAFLSAIRKRADAEGMSITQLINIAAEYYLNNTKPKMKGRKR